MDAAFRAARLGCVNALATAGAGYEIIVVVLLAASSAMFVETEDLVAHIDCPVRNGLSEGTPMPSI
jgi:hypothetical protein